MTDDSGSEKVSTPAEVIAHKKRFLWWTGGVVVLIALSGVIWWALHKHSPALSRWLMLSGLAVVLIALIWKVPQWQVEHVRGLEPRERWDRVNEARKTLATILGGAVLLAGLFGTWKNLQVAQESASTSQKALLVSQEGQITDRFTKAIEQLGAVNPDGKPKIEVRLGGIYALERIANESEKDHWPIMEVLCTYVRENAPRINEESAKTKVASHPAADIQAIVTVLGRRSNREHEQRSQRLDLSDVDLRGAHFHGADLSGAFLAVADLAGADFISAHLHGADLADADLRGAHLFGADLSGADLNAADLRGTELLKADLNGADLRGAHLRGAHLGGADLGGADLTQEQLEGAEGNSRTRLPKGLHMPESWKK